MRSSFLLCLLFTLNSPSVAIPAVRKISGRSFAVRRGNVTSDPILDGDAAASSVAAVPSSSTAASTSKSSSIVPSVSKVSVSDPSPSPKPDVKPPPCGWVTQYYHQTPKDWVDHKVDAWLDNWWKKNADAMKQNPNGFAGAFGDYALRNPDWSCRDDGSSSNCDFELCDQPVLNGLGGPDGKGLDLRPTYYVLQSVQNLHGYFIGLSQSFSTAAIAAALSKDKWALTFYKDKDDKSAGPLGTILNVITIVVATAACAFGVGGIVAGAVFAAAAAAVQPEVLNLISGHKDDTLQKSGDLGAMLSGTVIKGMKSFTTTNNDLMLGKPHGDTGDIRKYLTGGVWDNFGGTDKNAVIDAVNNMLIGSAINSLWRTMKVFILGGGKCGDGEGIGKGPQHNSLCKDGKAWYLYWWQENDVVSTTAHQWGWVNAPPGADQLGQGDYVGVTVQAVISSSLDAYHAAGYNYDPAKASDRASSAIVDGWANPISRGAEWEGIFSIPVCDISTAINKNYPGKGYIMEDYGHDSRLWWCGPICSDDTQKTKDFIKAVNMDGFQSPKHYCPYGTAPY
ncbi:MAG: hypothetical protein Q9227_007492 [Pyrenula ochraceoflavens]